MPRGRAAGAVGQRADRRTDGGRRASERQLRVRDGETAVELRARYRLPNPLIPSDVEYTPAHRQLLPTDLHRSLLAARLGIGGRIPAHQQRVRVLVVHPQQPLAGVRPAGQGVDRKVGDEVVSEPLRRAVRRLRAERVVPPGDDGVLEALRQHQLIRRARANRPKELRGGPAPPGRRERRRRGRGGTRSDQGGVVADPR